MALFDEPGLERVAVGHVAVVRAVEVALAGDLVRLRVGLVHGAKGGPTHLTAEDLPAALDDAELVDHARWRAHALGQPDRFALALQCGARRVVAPVFEHLQQVGGDKAEVVSAAFEDEADGSTHGGWLRGMRRVEARRRAPRRRKRAGALSQRRGLSNSWKRASGTT